MPYERVRDILDQVKDFHAQLRAWSARRSEAGGDPRAEWIVRYVDGYEQELQRTLSTFTNEGRATLLDTWIQNVPDRDLREKLAATAIEEDMPPEEVVRRLLEIDREIVRFYRNLSATLIPPRVGDAFAALADVHETKSREYSRRLVEWADEGGGDRGASRDDPD